MANLKWCDSEQEAKTKQPTRALMPLVDKLPLLWESKFTPSILMNEVKPGNPKFSWGLDSMREATTSNQTNTENMKTQQNKFLEK